jgi:hypothetical protein
MVPDVGNLERVYRAGLAWAYFGDRTADIAQEALEYGRSEDGLYDLRGRVQEVLNKFPELSWEQVVKKLPEEVYQSSIGMVRRLEDPDA